MNQKYDIFISYRREDAGDKAEHLKDLLEPHYQKRVSFDRENLTGVFDVALINRIDRCKDFLLVLGKNSLVYGEKDNASEQVEYYERLARCTQEEFAAEMASLKAGASIDFVRIEIARALHRTDLNIIPVVPESTAGFSFSRLQLPPDIARIKRYEAVFYSDNPDALFKDVVPKIRKHLKSKPDHLFFRKMIVCLMVLLVVITLAWGGWHYNRLLQDEKTRQELLVEELNNQVFFWNPLIGLEQLRAVHEIVARMEPVMPGGTFMMGPELQEDGTYGAYVETDFETPPVEQTVDAFYMGRYEVTVSQWCRVMQQSYDASEADMPMTNVSLDDCLLFCDSLRNLTGLNFSIPTEAEWEYAARGGKFPDGTLYAGGNLPDEVAWYVGNSGKRAHICDATNSGMRCNALNLFDMSGNVSEWCLWTDSVHRLYSDMTTQEVTRTDVIYNQGVAVIRGGNYLSEPHELTVFHRDTSSRTQKSPNIGLRLIIKKEY